VTPPPGDIEQLKAQFNTAMESIRGSVKDMVDKFNGVVAQVRKWAWLLGAATLWWIRNRLDQVRDEIQQLIHKVRYALDHQVPVISLFVSSFGWLSSVMTPVSEISSKTTTKESVNLSAWTGAASSAYAERATGQKTAVDESVNKAKFASDWLFGIAKSNVEFAVSLAKTLTGAVGKLVAALADSETVVGIPWAVEQLSDGIAGIVTDGLNRLLEMANRFVEVAGNIRNVVWQVGDHSKFPGGKWPEAIRG
jgi:hypothetical protein